MPPMLQPIADVKPENVGQTVQDFVDNGVSKVEVILQGNGRYTVIPSI